MDITKKLFEFKDIKYKSFHEKLIPNVPCDKVIGIRTPVLRKLAKELYNKNQFDNFLSTLPHKYYEQNNLHAFLIENIKDFDLTLYETEKFLPFIDNWATCDSFLPPVFKKNTEKLLPEILKWIKSDKTYTVRYAIGLLLKLYSDENFDEKYLDIVSSVKSDEYYIKMMIAWYFATLLAKQYDKTIPYIQNRVLDKWIHNKAIQKALESYRIDLKTKKYLQTLKIK